MKKDGLIKLITGILLALAGANLAAWGTPSAGRDPYSISLILGCVAIVAGSTLVRKVRSGVPHTATDPIAVGLVVVGIVALAIVMFIAGPELFVFGMASFAVSFFLGGTLLMRSRAKGAE